MKKVKIFALGVLVGMISFGFITYKLNPLANQLVTAVLWYQFSDEKKAMYLQSFNIARQAVENYLSTSYRENSKPLAVIVDIDETMLDNSPFEAMLVKKGKTFSYHLWNQWVKQERAKALPGAVEFTHWLKDKGIEVFYISNRKKFNQKYTLKNLQNQGFAYADSTHLLLKTTTSDKTERRKQVLEKYEVICYLGDNMGDFDQKYVPYSNDYSPKNIFDDQQLFGTKYIIMPNPMYGNWSRIKYPKKVKTPEQKALYRIQILKD